MSKVLAKFILGGCTPIQVSYHGEVVTGANVSLRASQGEPFGDATPSGGISMSIHNPAAAQVFVEAPLESAFYVLFEPASEYEQALEAPSE